jgi:hypothetical protein
MDCYFCEDSLMVKMLISVILYCTVVCMRRRQKDKQIQIQIIVRKGL